MTMARGGRERGSMTVMAVALLSVISVVGMLGLGLAQWAVAAARLSSAADIAALAGANAPAESCGRAAQAAAANGTTLVGCVVEGLDVVATVQAPAPPFAIRVATLLGGDASVLQRSARAGQEDVEQSHGP